MIAEENFDNLTDGKFSRLKRDECIAFWIKNEISSSGTWCVHTINIQVTELSFDWFPIENLQKFTLLRYYVLRVRKKIPHTLYIQELHKFSRFWILIKRELRGQRVRCLLSFPHAYDMQAGNLVEN